MTETNVNIPLLRKAVEWAEVEAAKPFASRQWNQDFTYLPQNHALAPSCGSAYCIAGWVVATHYDVENPYDAVNNSALAAARDLLGIDNDQALELFAASNDITEIRTIAEKIAGERL